MGFFDNTPFGSGKPENIGRLNYRYNHLIAPHLDDIRGKTVLDLGCQTGRWSYAALEAGASEVVGVDARDMVAQHLRRDGRFRFVQMNIDRWEPMKLPDQFDVIFCFGLLYHVINHFMICAQILELRPQLAIYDTGVLDHEVPLAAWFNDDANNISMGVAYGSDNKFSPIGVASVGAYKFIAKYFNYEYREIPWTASEITDFKESVKDYLSPQIPGNWSRYYAKKHPDITHVRKSFSMHRLPK